MTLNYEKKTGNSFILLINRLLQRNNFQFYDYTNLQVAEYLQDMQFALLT